ncbi:SUN domain-containing protein 1 isoform X2 [Sorex araneus]|uniref:SUN domain-containing protein 1 isoform X2 n=1 Tax=Sorex araneus TaxID=42254 RepID=UPI0024338029|nr:SUN domain-containing protein 1 isoform X2 [Sorex araneus]
MDFSRLHLYTPPQCVPENTGYTYALSSSYSSDALDFETEHKLDPVFDSPRMSRRSLRLVTTAYGTEDSQAGDAQTHPGRGASLKDRTTRTTKQHRNVVKASSSLSHSTRTATTSAICQADASGLQADTSLRPPVLDESLIREHTKVAHFWGLDDDGDVRGELRGGVGGGPAQQGNGDVIAQAAAASSNGYTCRDCRLLGEHREALSTLALRPRPGLTSRIYSRDRSQKRGVSFYADRTLWLAKFASTSLSAFLAQLFQVVLMKLNCESENDKLKSHELKTRESESTKSESHECKASSSRYGGTSVDALAGEHSHLSVSAESRGDGSLGEKHTDALLLSSWPRWGAGAGRNVYSYAGKAASGLFWWLGSGWYQLVTLVSWLNVFLLTRCLRNLCKFLLLFIPLLILLGFSLWGQSGLLSFLPVLNWTDMRRAQRVDESSTTLFPDPTQQTRLPEGDGMAPQGHWTSAVERRVTSLSEQCHSHEEKLRELTALLQQLYARVDGAGAETLALVQEVVGQHLQTISTHGPLDTQGDMASFRQNHELRISELESVLRKLTERSEAIEKELEQSRLQAASGKEEERGLLSTVERLELELGHLRAQLSGWEHWKSSCEQGDGIQERVDAQVRETVRLMFSGDWHDDSLEWLLRKFSSEFVSRDDLQVVLRDLELQILRNISHHISVTKQMPTPETVAPAMREAGLSGITEAQAQAIVSKALKLYSQDKTGMVDFALESGGGSILSTRCSETYETKTALISLFGIPLWYYSQSPRVVIQPDIYPGNCWAFRGSQGYLVVRLSMTIHPTTFTLEHIPKTLSPTGNITSAPKDFAVYGLENEYQEEGSLLGQYVYDQDGESLQMFHVLKRPEQAFQIVELQIFSNWGHPEYTCLYRFRVHGEPIK